ncbi:MAG: tetratricopeptide repeat protein [Desulfonatronovibrionaceae bacterium]
MLRIFVPADNEFMADLLWMQSCYYFGEHFLTDRKYDLLDEYLELIIELAPKWKRPYSFAAIIFPLEAGDVDKGLEFLDKAIERHPDVWRFPFYKGVYLMQYKGDMEQAGTILHKAASLPGAPEYLSRLSATLATKAGRRRLARRFLRDALERAGDPKQRKAIQIKLKELMQDDEHGTAVEGR